MKFQQNQNDILSTNIENIRLFLMKISTQDRYFLNLISQISVGALCQAQFIGFFKNIYYPRANQEKNK